MLIYFSSRGCPKCGGKNTQDTHYGPGAQHVSERLSLGTPERIRRRCFRCAYCWDEAPLDAVAPEGGQGG